MAELFFKEEVYRIVGACFEVYKDKGHGFVEYRSRSGKVKQ